VARRGLGSTLGWTLVLLVLAAIVLAGYTSYQALRVKDGLETVAGELDPAVRDLQAGDARSLRERLATVQDGAAEAADNSDGPGWWLASRLPRFGDDVEAIRTVADVSDVLASGVLPDVVKALGKVENVDPYAGPEAVAQLERAAGSLSRAEKDLREQEERVAAIPVGDLDPRLAAPVRRMQSALAEADSYLRQTFTEAQQALDAVPSLS
jgi:hypothetical protein